MPVVTDYEVKEEYIKQLPSGDKVIQIPVLHYTANVRTCNTCPFLMWKDKMVCGHPKVRREINTLVPMKNAPNMRLPTFCPYVAKVEMTYVFDAEMNTWIVDDISRSGGIDP